MIGEVGVLGFAVAKSNNCSPAMVEVSIAVMRIVVVVCFLFTVIV